MKYAAESVRRACFGLFLLLMVLLKTSWGAPSPESLPVFGTLGGALALEPTDPERYAAASVKLVAFGYTRCRHVCPMILAKYAQVQRQIDTERDFVSVFVSFDSERDDSDQLRTYLGLYSAEIVGMSGHKQQVDRAMQQFGAAYAATGAAEDYDHTQRIFLLDGQNRVRALFEPNTPTDQILSRINQLL